MAEPNSLKIGDVVTHPNWEPGTTRKIVAVNPLKRHPNMPDPGYPENVCTLDAAAHNQGESTEGMSEAELALGRHWMEAGLEHAPPGKRQRTPRGWKKPGDDRRVGAVELRSQLKNPITGTWTKREDKTGKFVEVKVDPKPFKGVRKTKGR
jgi:hypothetical protein